MPYRSSSIDHICNSRVSLGGLGPWNWVEEGTDGMAIRNSEGLIVKSGHGMNCRGSVY